MAELTTMPPCTRLILRGREAALDAAAATLGFPLPETCRGVVADYRVALWLGPDEFLLLMRPDDQVAADLARALQPHAHALVDVSRQQVALQLHGPDAADILNAGCPLDLHPDAFPVGMCTRTVLAKAEIILWRVAPETFRLGIVRSFAPYVHSFLEEAARG